MNYEQCLDQAQTFRQQGKRALALESFRRAHALNPQAVWAQLNVAIELRELGRLDEAQSEFEAALRAKPAWPEAWRELAQTLQRAKRFAPALAAFREALQLKPDDDWSQLGAFVALRELNQLEEAEQMALALLSRGSRLPGAWYEGALLARRRQQRSQALARFRQVLVLKPEHEWAMLGCLVELRELGRLEEAETMAHQLLAREPAFIGAWSEAAQLARRRRDHEAALLRFRRALQIQGSDAFSALGMAMALRELGRRDEAEAAYAQALSLKPDYADAWREYGLFAREGGQSDAALQRLETALSFRPQDGVVLAPLLELLRERGELASADALLDRLLQQPSPGFEVLSAAAVHARRLGRNQEALQRLERALAVRPKEPTMLNQYGIALREAMRLDEASQVYELLLRDHPGFADAWLQAGIVARARNRGDLALQYFERAAALSGEPAAFGEVINELRRLGQLDEAQRRIESATQLSEGARHHHLGMLAAYRDQNEAAMQCYAEGVRRHPDFQGNHLALIQEQSRAGLFAEALAAIEAAAQRFPAAGIFELERIRLLRRSGQPEAALQAAETALARQPADRSLNLLRARCLIDMGELGEASEMLRALPPGSNTVQRCERLELEYLIAKFQYRYEDAVTLLDEWAAMTADPIHILFVKAILQMSLGHITPARATLQQVRDLRRRHGSERVRNAERSGLPFEILSEFRANPFASGALEACAGLPPRERLAVLAGIAEQEPAYPAASIGITTVLRQLGVMASFMPKPDARGIPRRIVQFWDSEPPPEDIQAAMRSWRQQHPDYEHVVFNDRSAEAFLRDEYAEEMVEAFQAPTHAAMRADFFRLAFLYRHGGIYADADDACRHSIEPWLPPGCELLLLQEDIGSIGNNFLAVCAGHPLIGMALERVKQSLLAREGGSIWFVSGPGLLTNTFCQLYRDSLLREGLPEGVAVIDVCSAGRCLSMHLPRQYKLSEKNWLSAANQKREQFRRRPLQLRGLHRPPGAASESPQ